MGINLHVLDGLAKMRHQRGQINVYIALGIGVYGTRASQNRSLLKEKIPCSK